MGMNYDEENEFKEMLGVTRDITEIVKLRDEIIKLSETDKLTQLYNRYKPDDGLEKEFKRTKRTLIPFTVILLDIDHFKLVNDRFGHQTGDIILRELAAVLKNSIRSTDMVGRWGGEEFILSCRIRMKSVQCSWRKKSESRLVIRIFRIRKK